jgi:hypothetical protein
MRIAAVAVLSLCALPGVADGPKVNRGMIEAMQHSLDNKLSRLWLQVPAEVLGLSQGTYIRGYGVVFLSEVNLAPAAGISPFHPSVGPDEASRKHDKKLQRLATVRTAMRAPCKAVLQLVSAEQTSVASEEFRAMRKFLTP